MFIHSLGGVNNVEHEERGQKISRRTFKLFRIYNVNGMDANRLARQYFTFRLPFMGEYAGRASMATLTNQGRSYSNINLLCP
jgi:hypothetical protein